MLEEVAVSLGALADELVFVGGASLALYLQAPQPFASRFTDDVDCVLAASSLPQFHEFEKRLRKMGFAPCQDPGAPICRWMIGAHRVDFMSQEATVLGFSNRWYAEGCSSAIKASLPNGRSVKIFSLPYFLATKIEAYLDRGGPDLRLSQDLEDVISVLGSRNDLETLAVSIPGNLRGYFGKHAKALLENPGFDEALSSALETDRPAPKAKARVLDFFRVLTDL
jgi:predicted nucleotidyltransferase